MATHETEIKWVGDLRFDALQNGRTIRIDGDAEHVSTGVRPKALILTSLAGCTGIDVVDMLTKMRVQFTDFSMKVTGDLTEDHPRTYHTVHLTYVIRLVNPADKDKMEKAVKLSEEKYCGVSAMIRKFADLQVKIEYL
jgi:putative redox protein